MSSVPQVPSSSVPQFGEAALHQIYQEHLSPSDPMVVDPASATTERQLHTVKVTNTNGPVLYIIDDNSVLACYDKNDGRLKFSAPIRLLSQFLPGALPVEECNTLIGQNNEVEHLDPDQHPLPEVEMAVAAVVARSPPPSPRRGDGKDLLFGSYRLLTVYNEAGSPVRKAMDNLLYPNGVPPTISSLQNTCNEHGHYTPLYIQRGNNPDDVLPKSLITTKVDASGLRDKCMYLTDGATVVTNHIMATKRRLDIRAVAEYLCATSRKLAPSISDVIRSIHGEYVTSQVSDYLTLEPEERREVLFLKSASIIAEQVLDVVVDVVPVQQMERTRETTQLAMKDTILLRFNKYFPSADSVRGDPEALDNAMDDGFDYQCGIHFAGVVQARTSPYDYMQDPDCVQPTLFQARRAFDSISVPVIPESLRNASLPRHPDTGLSSFLGMPHQDGILVPLPGGGEVACLFMFASGYTDQFSKQFIMRHTREFPEASQVLYESQREDFPIRDIVPLIHAGALGWSTTVLRVIQHLRKVEITVEDVFDDPWAVAEHAVLEKSARNNLLLFSTLPMLRTTYRGWRHQRMHLWNTWRQMASPSLPTPRARVNVQNTLPIEPLLQRGQNKGQGCVYRPSSGDFSSLFSKDLIVMNEAFVRMGSFIKLTVDQ